MSNSSSLKEFLLLVFADTRELQLLHSSLFLGIYLPALLANSLIITAVACHHRLHTPMYFFLLHLSLLDLGSISSMIPKSMASSLRDTRAISYSGCAAQIFFFALFMSALDLVLAVLYSVVPPAVNPLLYSMRNKELKEGFEFIPLLQQPEPILFDTEESVNVCHRSPMSGESKKSNDSSFNEFLLLAFADTRELQLLHFSLFLALDLVVAVVYAVVPPAVNPLLYSMRNKELKEALKKLIQLVLVQQH
ncbi:olfactory receptor 14I1-like [Struthio camelus]|uniref:olfactory receptor 14I1-like n=1 Tax=Struthio camelus TaxID=8801 RepID=UPI0036041D5E